MSAVVGSQYRATTEAAESLIAQLNSQGKLTTPKRKNKKLDTPKIFLKAISWDYPLNSNGIKAKTCVRLPIY
jgi:hypothetical protein